MELAAAVLGFLGKAVGGVASYFATARQASAAENIAHTQHDTQLAWFDTLVQGWLSQERSAEIGAYFGRDVAQIEGDVQRTRIFYNYQSAAAMRGVLIALGGAGLLGAAVYLAAKEDA